MKRTTTKKWPGHEGFRRHDARWAAGGIDRSHTPTSLAYGITDAKGWLIKEGKS